MAGIFKTNILEDDDVITLDECMVNPLLPKASASFGIFYS